MLTFRYTKRLLGSLYIFFSHVVVGRPIGFFTNLRNSSSVCFAGVSSSKRITCPSHLNLHFITPDHGSAFVTQYISSMVMIFG